MTGESKTIKVSMIETVGGHGGLEVYDFGVCKSLVDAGCDVTLYTCDKTKGEGFESAFKIKRLFNNIYGDSLPLLRFISFLKGMFATFIDINRRKPDVIYLHVFTFSVIEFLLLCMSLLVKSKIFVNVHDPVSFGRSDNKLLKSWFFRIFKMKSVNVSTHTSYSKTIMSEMFPGLDVVLMPHSDIDFIYDNKQSSEVCRAELGLDSNAQYALFFGQIKKTKGLSVLLNSWASVVSVFPEAKLLIVGRCWQNDCGVYKSLIVENNIADNVIWIEKYIDDYDVPMYFRSSDVVVLPYSRIYSSGVVLRSMGYATPVVVSDQSAFTEIIEDGKDGVVFKTDDYADLSDKLISILSDSEKRRELSLNASNKINNNHSWDVIGKKMQCIFEVCKNEHQ